jgi:hypothetical protein
MMMGGIRKCNVPTLLDGTEMIATNGSINYAQEGVSILANGWIRSVISLLMRSQNNTK